jgi:hypothetical protein
VQVPARASLREALNLLRAMRAIHGIKRRAKSPTLRVRNQKCVIERKKENTGNATQVSVEAPAHIFIFVIGF